MPSQIIPKWWPVGGGHRIVLACLYIRYGSFAADPFSLRADLCPLLVQ